jgi:hypothetical protein
MNELLKALQRANRLIKWMSTYIGNMAPGGYADCYKDLNAHCVFMAGLKDPDRANPGLEIYHGPIGPMFDVTKPKLVEISVAEKSNGLVVWVNIDGVCRLRVCRLKPNRLTIEVPNKFIQRKE